jgi:hypothetical protein
LIILLNDPIPIPHGLILVNDKAKNLIFFLKFTQESQNKKKIGLLNEKTTTIKLEEK